MEEIEIVVVDRENVEVVLNIPAQSGLNLMELCKAAGLPVEGTCGGLALCGSCHVLLISNNSLPDMSDAEALMLDQLPLSKSNSRLACQIKLNQDSNHLKVKLAPI
ncbi:MAG: 2Fe-2S iron-sulfur cluster binding domain-containing protein [Saprospiraceae bacterium]|nr:2Fe-2S iron-sulfur cluster binding domain-containing protein [Candidatus Vicinibacter affinis]MBP6172264.1 2Fe-2S iron-sulfur cluster binding domain-containing protein [Saprospiraceae bacterium]MBK6572038.1 2Fe-2S iron-sulfur cluster binding domain-containing protein [Candidatus Vicinibacter affinis]MBK6823962.1 2Fe-2S iron-sulfur cluster binding domain-containing protein [Candidatus Vicinibacter affinis]MBK7305176.1 2Fe-2S iron-sulfur cluster binding domain-containing protein [Candidatus Vi